MNVCLWQDVAIADAVSPAEMDAARRLFLNYRAWLAVDLCYQNFDQELRTLPGAYARPRGRLLLARVGGEIAGCVALRPLEPGLAEMKRLWVEPGFAGHGLGRALVDRLIAEARAIGYRAIRLDTLPDRMHVANRLYRAFGFREIPPYAHSPLAGILMMELVLEQAPDRQLL